MLSNYIAQSYLQKNITKTLRRTFQKNKPFPYIILPNFFQPQKIDEIAHALHDEPFTYHDTDLYRFSQTQSLLHSLNPTLSHFTHFLNSLAFKEYITALTSIKVPPPIDCAGFRYANCDYLLPHDDSLETRKIAYALYLTKGFKKSDGGSLDFFHANKIVRSIPPRYNTLVLFKVRPGKTFHQVREILSTKQRYSIAGWFNAPQ